MYSDDRLIILDVDGTTVDAFAAMERAFSTHDLSLGDLTRFQKRRHLFKYLGGLKEFPKNIAKQITRKKREALLETLTEIYRDEASLYEGMGAWINQLINQADVRVGLVTRNVTENAPEILKKLFARHDVDTDQFDFLMHLPLSSDKSETFRKIRKSFGVNPAKSFACGDEKKDYIACQETGFHPFIVSYGFEDFERLTQKIGVPMDIISDSPEALRHRVNHALKIS